MPSPLLGQTHPPWARYQPPIKWKYSGQGEHCMSMWTEIHTMHFFEIGYWTSTRIARVCYIAQMHVQNFLGFFLSLSNHLLIFFCCLQSCHGGSLGSGQRGVCTLHGTDINRSSNHPRTEGLSIAGKQGLECTCYAYVHTERRAFPSQTYIAI